MKPIVSIFLLSALAYGVDQDTSHTNRAAPAGVTRESDCKAILDYNVAGECLKTVRAGQEFKITPEEYRQIMEHRSVWAPGLGPAPTEPPRASQFDTVLTRTIRNGDTSVAISVSPHKNTLETEENISSMAGSLRFMAVLSAIEVAVGAVFLIIAVSKK